VAQSPVISRFLGRLHPELAQSFSSEQLAAVEMHFGMRYQMNHMVDWRTRIRLPFAKLYLVVLAGHDRQRAEG
jgi:hypothetical protein